MPRNVEIKAKDDDIDAVVKAAETLSGQGAQLIEQLDVLFHGDRGRIKLRILKPSLGILIFDQRDDIAGPKTSTYNVVETDKPDELRSLLGNAYGEAAIVPKRRRLFIVGRMRTHIDTVERIGDYHELEVRLEDDEKPQTGEDQARRLMNQLGTDPSALAKGADADLLASKV